MMTLAPKVILITAADTGFASLAEDLLASIQRFKFKNKLSYGLLDLGLTAEKRAFFEGQSVQVETVKSDINYPMREVWENQKPSIKTLTARPYLRRYFPGYDVYIWMDADVWVQTPDALETMIYEASRSLSLCIASELDRCYGAYFTNVEVWENFNRWYSICYGSEVAAAMTFKPMMNAGVFAMNAKAPHWEAWADLYASYLETVTTGITPVNFMADQLALNLLLYMKGLPCVVLPASYNWLALIHAMPKLDETTGYFVEPFPPHRTLAHVHLAGRDKDLPREIEKLNGQIISRALTFRAFQAALIQPDNSCDQYIVREKRPT